MSYHDSDEELNIPNSDNNNNSESLINERILPLYNNSLNTTPTNDVEYLERQISPHKHSAICYHNEAFICGVEYIHKIKQEISPNQLTPCSADDGFLEGNHSPLRSSDCSDRNLSETSSSSSYYNEDICKDGLCNHVEHYLAYLRRSRRDKSGCKCPQLPRFEKHFYTSFEILINSFIEKQQTPTDWFNELSLHRLSLNKVGQEILTIFRSIFEDGITWGRIVIIIGFIGEIVLSALSIGRHELINEVLQISVDYTHQNLWSWILEHGGWHGISEMTQQRDSQSEDISKAYQMISKVAGAAAFALASVAICKFLTDHI